MKILMRDMTGKFAFEYTLRTLLKDDFLFKRQEMHNSVEELLADEGVRSKRPSRTFIRRASGVLDLEV